MNKEEDKSCSQKIPSVYTKQKYGIRYSNTRWYHSFKGNNPSKENIIHHFSKAIPSIKTLFTLRPYSRQQQSQLNRSEWFLSLSK